MPSIYQRLYDKEALGLLDDKALADKHFKAAHKLANSGVCDHELDPIMCILTICVMLYSPDFKELDDPYEVERIQMSYAYLLQR